MDYFIQNGAKGKHNRTLNEIDIFCCLTLNPLLELLAMNNHITNHIGLSAEGTLNIRVNREEQFPRLLKALRKGETIVLEPTNDRTLFVGNMTEETWKDGKTRGILFKPTEQLTLALNGKTLTRNFWGGNQKTEVKQIVIASRQSKMIF